MIRPPSCISGTARCASRLSASALVSMHQRQCLSVMSIVGFSTPDAALLTTMSSAVEVLARTRANISSTLSGMPTLPWIATARRPSARISAHSASASSCAVVVVDGDVGALGRELERDRAADAAGGAGDERDFAGKRACHRFTECCLGRLADAKAGSAFGAAAPATAVAARAETSGDSTRAAATAQRGVLSAATRPRAARGSSRCASRHPVLLDAVPDVGRPQHVAGAVSGSVDVSTVLAGHVGVDPVARRPDPRRSVRGHRAR